jgi:DNA-binding NtrC family response regulator
VIGSKKAVLIVDDVDEMREMLQSLVDGLEGFKVSASCSNCAEARLELTRRRPSLVLLDEVLPGESSADFLQELVADGVPVALMTGMEKPTHEVPAGMIRFAKPGWKSIEQDAIRILDVLNQVLAASLSRKSS